MTTLNLVMPKENICSACHEKSVASIAPRRQPRCQSQRSVPKQLVAHVRPELLCHIEKRIQGYLLSPLIRGISK